MNKTLWRVLSILVATACLLAAAGTQPAQAILWTPLMVKSGGLTSGTCSDWVNACDLQYALSIATSADHVWVKKGLYLPTSSRTDRNATFSIKPGTMLYGGFAGTEGDETLRNWQTNRTILSGDIDKNDLNADGNRVAEKWTHVKGSNSYHVVTLDGGTGYIGASTRLDGFIITAGMAEPFEAGGGLYCTAPAVDTYCSPTLANLTISGNRAYNGGGMVLSGASGGFSNPNLYNVTFRGNYGEYLGGGLYIAPFAGGTSSPTLTNVTFKGNYALEGAGIANNSYNVASLGNAVLTNVTFSGNRAGENGGGIYNLAREGGHANLTLWNVTFSGNSAVYRGGALYDEALSTGMSSPWLGSVTFNANHAGANGGAMANIVGTGGTSVPELNNVILWGDTAPANSEIYNSGATPNFTHNIVQGSMPGGIWDPALGNNVSANLDVDPKLAPLASNGGLTQTMLLKMGSPAVDAGILSGCLSEDQRDLARPQGTNCDIGAVESRYVQVTFRSQGVNDGWVLESGHTTNVGGSRNSTATTLLMGDDESDRQFKGVVSFNTAGLPDAAVIAAATLKLKHAGSAGVDPFTSLSPSMSAHMKRGSFGTAVLQIADWQAPASAYNVASIAPALVDGWYSGPILFDMGLVNTTGLTQFQIMFRSSHNHSGVADYLEVYSGNAPLDDRPILLVTYIAP